MKYTKSQLLGSHFKWTYEYIVVENESGVQLMCLDSPNKGTKHSAWTLDHLNNNCLDALILSTLNNKKIIEIY